MYQKGRAWIELNMENLAHNVSQFQKLLPYGCALMPAVKANAYGHGASLICSSLERMGISNFCVASVSEAIELRQAGISGQILILGYTSPLQFDDLFKYGLTQTIVDFSYARQLNDCGLPIRVHAGIDTGMHRLGERSENIENICKFWELKNLNITGVFSHLCVSDGNSAADRAFTLAQIEKFRSVIAALHKKGIYGFKTHMQGSYGVLNYPELKFDYVRIGIALYGTLCTPKDHVAADVKLRPVLSLKSRIECIRPLHPSESIGYGLTFTAKKEMQIAAVSIGYADGIPRSLSNKGYVLVNGNPAPIIGRICMDQLLIDVSGIPGASSGDEVIFIGKCKNIEISAGDLAQNAGTISNEILSRLGNRLERIAV